jgi:predicted Zn-dependent peptidase
MPSILLDSQTSTLTQPLRHQLPSGLTIITEQIPVEAVTLDCWVKAGSAVEPDAINGMAHFLEHMIFKGSPLLQCGEFEQQVEARGAYTNAATSQDYTHYYIGCAPKDFAALAPLQLDLVIRPKLPEPDFESERRVVLEEIRRAQDNPQRRTYYTTMTAAFEQLPYRRPVLGPTSVIESLTVQQMRAFHQHWYQPQNITIAAVGNLPATDLLDMVLEHLNVLDVTRATAQPAPPGVTSPIGRPTHVENGRPPQQSPAHSHQASSLPIDLMAEPAFSDRVQVDRDDVALQQARLVMVWRVPGLRDQSETYALDVLASVLGHGRTSRLVWDLKQQRRLVNQISASNATYAGQGLFTISAKLESSHLDRVEALVKEHI